MSILQASTPVKPDHDADDDANHFPPTAAAFDRWMASRRPTAAPGGSSIDHDGPDSPGAMDGLWAVLMAEDAVRADREEEEDRLMDEHRAWVEAIERDEDWRLRYDQSEAVEAIGPRAFWS